MKARRFEDLTVWQKARLLTKSVYEVTRKEDFARDFGLSGQIQRAVVSVMSNIAEGFERGNRGDYHRFLCIAKASNGEVRSQLYIALDIGYLNQSEFDRLLGDTEELSRMLSALIATVAQHRDS
jgi:four helix bundle protein